ncbi:MAG TPA: hypothetical protein VFE20_03285 [Thermoleophilia bacterium]|nr:hypothetical protein [Thermoleophilia bacterium]
MTSHPDLPHAGTTPPDDFGRALRRRAPRIADAGAWTAILPRARRIRRRRRMVGGGMAAVAVAMLVGGAAYLSGLEPTDRGLTAGTQPRHTDGSSSTPSYSTTLPSGRDAPPVSEAGMQMAHDSLQTLLRAVLLDDRGAFVDLYAPADRAAAEQLFADERVRLQKLGPNAYYLKEGVPARFNWMVGVDWALTWIPTSPTPELGTWVTADPRTRMLVGFTTMDGVTRFLPLVVDGDAVYVRALGGSRGSEDLAAFDLLGRTPSDVVAAYFAALQKGDYAAAWELLSEPRPSLDQFKKEGATANGSERHEVGAWTLLDTGNALVEVTIVSAAGMGGPSLGPERWLCVKQDGEWRGGWITQPQP